MNRYRADALGQRHVVPEGPIGGGHETARVRRDADDRTTRRCTFPDDHAFAQRIFAGEQCARERVFEDHHRGGRGAIVRSKRPAAKDRHPHGAEEVRGNRVERGVLTRVDRQLIAIRKKDETCL